MDLLLFLASFTILMAALNFYLGAYFWLLAQSDMEDERPEITLDLESLREGDVIEFEKVPSQAAIMNCKLNLRSDKY